MDASWSRSGTEFAGDELTGQILFTMFMRQKQGQI